MFTLKFMQSFSVILILLRMHLYTLLLFCSRITEALLKADEHWHIQGEKGYEGRGCVYVYTILLPLRSSFYTKLQTYYKLNIYIRTYVRSYSS